MARKIWPLNGVAALRNMIHGVPAGVETGSASAMKGVSRAPPHHLRRVPPSHDCLPSMQPENPGESISWGPTIPFFAKMETAMRSTNSIHSILKVGAAAMVMAFGLGASALAEETGELEYMVACSSCHGETAEGNGPMTRYLKIDTPNLTTLAAQNNGEFPLLEVIQVIDGRTGVGPHGTPMPVWGDRYMASAIQDGPYAAEIIVRGRILSLARYLESIQQ